MKINKKEALALAKVLHQHTGSSLAISPRSTHEETICALSERLDRFIMVDGADSDHVDANFMPKGSSVKGEEQPCDFFGDQDDEDECSQKEAADLEVAGGELHALAAAKAAVGAIEFEHVPGQVDLLLDGETTIECITHVCRHGKSLEVKPEDGAWISFEVSRFPKGWATLLPVGRLVSVAEAVR